MQVHAAYLYMYIDSPVRVNCQVTFARLIVQVELLCSILYCSAGLVVAPHGQVAVELVVVARHGQVVVELDDSAGQAVAGQAVTGQAVAGQAVANVRG